MTTNKTQQATGAQKQKRRYVRLEIFSPVEFQTIMIDRQEHRVRRHPNKKAGVLLNLSGGGVLISTTDLVDHDELVLMNFEIRGFDSLTNILCRVKRVEKQEDGERLVGMEFLSPDTVDDPILLSGLKKLTDLPQGFNESISRVISRFVFQRQIESETE